VDNGTEEKVFERVPQSYPPKVFNTKIKELREAHPEQPSIHDLAAKIGVTPTTMARIESGSDLKLTNAIALSLLFSKPIEYIWEAV
jgi:DNA-binding XRE family transcriptional regulator